MKKIKNKFVFFLQKNFQSKINLLKYKMKVIGLESKIMSLKKKYLKFSSMVKEI